mmetsp:Transcript_49882/g.121738  ORF Transcript_49882/g.121738 Transcript_49882/m.121738 type:complete len:94 (+) Transcript_49882:3-284(+)
MKDAHTFRSLFAAISTCSRLKSLNLSHTALVGKRLQDCLSELIKLTNLEDLKVNLNAMGCEDFWRLAGFLPKMLLDAADRPEAGRGGNPRQRG